MTATRHDIAFAGFDGTILRGWLYVPDGSKGPLAGVVMSHGYSATRHMGLPAFAQAIAEGGVAVLVYDHRCLGDSDGSPRQLIDPFLQMRDMLGALDWLAARPEIDPARLGLWGSSYSGGEVLIVGAMDPRVRAVVATVPYAGRPLELDKADADAFAALSAQVRKACQPDSFAPARLVVPQADDGGPAVMPQSEAAEWFLVAGNQPGSAWRNQAITSAQPPAVAYDPAFALPHLAAPTLFIVADEDRVAPADNAIAAAKMMDAKMTDEPGSLLLIAGHHFTPYTGAALAKAARAGAEHFRRWLGAD